MIAPTRIALLVVAIALVGSPSLATAQFGGFTDRLKEKIKDRANRAQDRAMEAGLDHAEKEVVDAGKRAVKGEGGAKGENAAKGESGAKGSGSATAGGKDAASKQRVGEGAWANFDFVPGERVLFAEDFSKDRVGNFPKRLEFIQGVMEVVEWQGKRWLRATEKSTFAIPLPEKLPDRFTIEMELTFPYWGLVLYCGPDGDVSEHHLAHEVENHFVMLSAHHTGLRERGRDIAAVDARNLFGKDNEELAGRLVKLRVHGDGRYVKVYLDEHRVANVPNARIQRTNAIYVEVTGYPPNFDEHQPDKVPTLIGSVSVNAGGREMYDALMSDGRFATQGIYFDTGSARLRPESTPTLKEIVAMLEEHPDLRICIEGHTDDVGSAASNQKLSEDRAAAVKAQLVSMGIAGSRLETRGFGSTKPVSPNTTPEGRQNNRRVELVKL